MAEAGTDPLVFDGLLTHLRQRGFDIGIDNYLRLQELLGKAGAECAPENLKTLLCPIFATSKSQQEQFYQAFDSYYSLFYPTAPEASAPEASGDAIKLPTHGARPTWSRGRLYLFAAVGLALCALLLVWRGVPKQDARSGAETAQDTSQAQATDPPRPQEPTGTPQPGAIESPSAGQPGQSARPSLYEESYLYKVARYQATHVGRVIYGLLTLWLAILAPLLLFLFYDQPQRRVRPGSRLYARLRPVSFWAAFLAQPLLWPALGGVGELWWFSDSRAWLAISASLIFFLFYGRAPQDAPPEGSRRHFERLRTPLLWLATLTSFGLFLYGLMFQRAALCAPPIFLLIYEWHQYKRRRLLLQKQRGRKPPFVWPVRLKSFAPRLFDSESFYQAARLMRRRQADVHYQLDLEATVAATAEALGYPTFRYKLATRPPEYLALIDRASFRDHQAQLYNELVKALEREGNYVVRYFYDVDPRVCCVEAGGDCLSLVELRARFAGHRLLVFGVGAGLLDPVTGRPSPWTSVLADWADGGLLTPTPPALWGFREVTLAGLFPVLPASVEGLLTLVTHFQSLAVTDAHSRRAPNGERLPALNDALDEEPAEVVKRLRAHLGEPTFQWLCACAVYPELHWDLTLYLGALPVMGNDLIREENLLPLVRLPWFRAGSIPDELRWQLLSELDREKERAIRLAIIEILEGDPPPRETYAADSYQLNLVVQRWLSRGDRRRQRELLAALDATPRRQVLRDYALLRYLESRPTSALNLYLPARLRNLFYRSGIPAFGLRTGIRLALMLLLIGVGFLAQQLFYNSFRPLSQAHARTTFSLTPAIAARTASNSCTACHTLRGGMDENCAACHQSDAFSASVSAPHAAANIGCADCHTEHRGADFRPDLMPISAEFQPGVPPEKTCAGCHNDNNHTLYQGRRVFTPHGGTLGYPVVNGQWKWKGVDEEAWQRKPDELRQLLANWSVAQGGEGARRSAQFHALHMYRVRLTGGLTGAEGKVSCSTCHMSIGARFDRETPRQACAVCHNGYTDRRTQLTVLAADKPNCISCHTEHVGNASSWGASFLLPGAQPAVSGQSNAVTQQPDRSANALTNKQPPETTSNTLTIQPRASATPPPPQQLSNIDFSKFSHVQRPHSTLACASCHQRASNNSTRPRLPGHKACTDCHLAQFVAANVPICNICHTDVGSSSDPPVKSFPPLRSFTIKFNHRQHDTGAARPADGCTACHRVDGSKVLSTVRGLAAHAACYSCHTPNARVGGRDISSCGTCHIISRAPKH